MGIVIGFIVIMLVIVVYASQQFALLSESKGYPPARARKYPFFLGLGAFFLNTLGQTILSFSSESMMALLFCCWGGLVVLILTAILIRAYKNMKRAPDFKSKQTK